MTIVVFTGPTLGPEAARAELEAVYLPPVTQGDVYRATLQRPQAIGIIDGYFAQVPSVWHKEILWAMSQGIHVFGSASMGALRAAELTAFGMEGVGTIFEAFCDGALEDDDEVAVAHGPAETGYRALSEAMVNIRATLAAARADAVVDAATQTSLQDIAKATFYPDRSYPLVLRRGAEQGLPSAQLAALRDWLPRGRVDQKRADAVSMLRLMRARFAEPVEPRQVRYSFEYTEKWNQLVSGAGAVHLDDSDRGEAFRFDRVLDEVRLRDDVHGTARRGGLLRFLAAELGWCDGIAVPTAWQQSTTEAFRHERQLDDAEQLDAWLERNDLDRAGFDRLMEDEALLRLVHKLSRSAADSYVEDYLRVSGQYADVLARARDKQRTLQSRGLDNPSLEEIGLTEGELSRWYFEQRLGREVETDVAGYARSIGFADEQAFRRAVIREFCYATARATAPGHLAR